MDERDALVLAATIADLGGCVDADCKEPFCWVNQTKDRALHRVLRLYADNAARIQGRVEQ